VVWGVFEKITFFPPDPLILIAVIVLMEKKVCWIMGLIVAIVTKTNGVKAYTCYTIKILLRYLQILSKKASTGSVTSESRSVTSPVTNAKKPLTMGGS
jgi:hypothetical protein